MNMPKEVISFSIQNLTRKEARSSVAFSAYISRSKLKDERTGLVHNYTNRSDLVYEKIFLPDHAPKQFIDRSILWNSVEAKEKNKNARIARSIRISLPRELTLQTHIEMLTQYIHHNFVDKGMMIDLGIHDKGDGNPHAHLLLTTRPIDQNGNWMNKQTKNYILDERGNKIYDNVKKTYKCSRSIKSCDWDSTESYEAWRKAWSDECNVRFRLHGISKEVTHMSYYRQGSDKVPTIHLDARTMAIEKQGVKTKRGDRNREILEINHNKELHRRRRYNERSRSHSR